mgnify:CR=1
MTHSQEPEDLQVLSHEAWPGYPLVFSLAFVSGLLYLGIIFLSWKG